jgi:RHS repeat-associated protein
MVLGGQAQDLPVLQMKYDSFGNIIEENGDFEIPFGFAGGIWDKDTKLTRFGVRDYDSETGRWTSKEPLGFDGSRNFYVYAGNDGVNWLDLTGKFPGQCFNTPLKAAMDAFQFYSNDIFTENGRIEIGGFIQDFSSDNNLCYIVAPFYVKLGTSTEVILSKVPIGAVATWHFHVINGKTTFSGKDIKFSILNFLDAYMYNQHGDILKYDQKLGNIRRADKKRSKYFDLDNVLPNGKLYIRGDKP